MGTNSGVVKWIGYRFTAATKPTPAQAIAAFQAGLDGNKRQHFDAFMEKTGGGGRWYWSSMTAKGREATEQLLPHLTEDQRQVCEELVFVALGGNHHMWSHNDTVIAFNIDLLQRFILDRIRLIDVDWKAMKELDDL